MIRIEGDSRTSPTSGLYEAPRTRTFAPFTALPCVVQQLADPVRDPRGHLRVDVLGLLEDPELVADVAADLPGEVGGIERDAVAADAGAGVERA